MIKVITSQSDPKPKQSQAKMFMLGHRDTKNADKMLGHKDIKNADRLGHRDIKNVENKKMGE